MAKRKRKKRRPTIGQAIRNPPDNNPPAHLGDSGYRVAPPPERHRYSWDSYEYQEPEPPRREPRLSAPPQPAGDGGKHYTSARQRRAARRSGQKKK